MRAIDGDALEERFQSLAYDDWNQGVATSWANAYRECADMVYEQPTIEPKTETKTPRWVAEDRFVKGHYFEYPHCPKCNGELTTGQCYCSICGQHIAWDEEEGEADEAE